MSADGLKTRFGLIWYVKFISGINFQFWSEMSDHIQGQHIFA